MHKEIPIFLWISKERGDFSSFLGAGPLLYLILLWGKGAVGIECGGNDAYLGKIY